MKQFLVIDTISGDRMTISGPNDIGYFRFDVNDPDDIFEPVYMDENNIKTLMEFFWGLDANLD